MSPFVAVTRALSAETLKLKRTLALWMVLIAPSVIVLLNFFVLLQRDAQYLSQVADAWQGLARNITMFWALLMLPLYVTLETALLGGVDHNGQPWKHLYALPLPRGSIYAAKWLTGVALAGASTIVLWIGTMLCGLLLSAIMPQIKFAWPIPAWDILRPMGLIFLVEWLVISIHLWVGLRWPSFTVSIGFGMVATTINIMIINSEKWSKVYPWTLSLYAIEDTANFLPTALAIGLVGGLMVGLIGRWAVSRREVM
jgi:hypothetical protein